MGSLENYKLLLSYINQKTIVIFSCFVILTLPTIMFGLTLDRYPDIHVDESFFNLPAVHWVQGKGFYAVAFSNMPYETKTFAKHGPLFVHTQKLTFWIFGIRHFSARITSLLCSTFAVLILCGFLIKRGYRFAPVFIASTYVVDPVWILQLDGRPEGMALLALAGALIAWVRMIEHPTFWRCFFWGLMGGTAIAVHPGTFFFAAVGFMVSLGMLAPSRWFHVTLGTIVGGLTTLIYWLAAWWPLWLESFEQFLRYANMQRTIVQISNFDHILNYLRNSRWYFFQISGVMIISGSLIGVGLLRNGWRILRRRSSGPENTGCWGRHKDFNQDEILFAGAAAFSTAGDLMFLSAAKFPYYMSYFMIWPPLLVAIGAEWGGLGWTRFGWGCRILALSLLLTALPSAAWNVTRVREAWRDYAALDPAIALARIQQAIPADVSIWASPPLYPLVYNLRNPVQLIPAYPHKEALPPDVWLILDQPHFEQQKSQALLLTSQTRSTHPRVFMIPLYERALGGPRSIFVLPPKNADLSCMIKMSGVIECVLWPETNWSLNKL